MRRQLPIYDPASDSGLEIWIDPTDTATSSIQAVGGGAISNGADIGQIASKKGNARNFVQWGTNARNTWDATGINGVAAMRCTGSSTLVSQVATGLQSLSGLTVLYAAKRNVNGVAIAFTTLDSGTGKNDVGLLQFPLATPYDMRGRRVRTDSFVSYVAPEATPTAYVYGCTHDFASGVSTLYECGARMAIVESILTPGTSEASGPWAISLGGLAQETGSALAFAPDGWLGAVLIWPRTLSADELVAPTHFLRRLYEIA
jgi:hypothetical protein